MCTTPTFGQKRYGSTIKTLALVMSKGPCAVAKAAAKMVAGIRGHCGSESVTGARLEDRCTRREAEAATGRQSL